LEPKSSFRDVFASHNLHGLPPWGAADAKRAIVESGNAFSSAIAVQQNVIEESSSLSEQMAHRR
jgi:hypothetical protein